jgi:hypothetical protein
VVALAVQPGVVERRARPPGDVEREREVVVAERAARLGLRERQRPDRAPAHGDRGDDQRRDPEPPQRPQLLVVDRDRAQVGVGHPRDEQGLARAQHRPGARRAHRADRPAALDVDRGALAAGVGVGDDEPLQAAVGRGEVDGAPVGLLGDGDAGDALEHLALVERLAQQLAGTGEEGRPLARAPLGLEQAHPVGDLDDERPEAEHRAVEPVPDGVPAADPHPLLPRARRRPAAHLDVEQGSPVSSTRRKPSSTAGSISGSSSPTVLPRWSSAGMPFISASAWFTRAYRRSRSKNARPTGPG